MPVEEAVKDDERQAYYKGYLESMVAAVSGSVLRFFVPFRLGEGRRSVLPVGGGVERAM